MDMSFAPIGMIHTPIMKREEAPIQSARSNIAGSVEIFSEFSEGLEGIEEFSHIYLLYHLNQPAHKLELKVKPFLDDQLHGVFATRFPVRPNPIGISIVRFDRRADDILFFTGADMLDGTPLLDIKPYIPEFDVFAVTKDGWYTSRKYE